MITKLGRTLSMHLNIGKAQTKIVSKYDQEIPQSQTADKPMAPRGRATYQSRDTRKTNKLGNATSSIYPIKMIAKLEGT